MFSVHGKTPFLSVGEEEPSALSTETSPRLKGSEDNSRALFNQLHELLFIRCVSLSTVHDAFVCNFDIELNLVDIRLENFKKEK